MITTIIIIKIILIMMITMLTMMMMMIIKMVANWCAGANCGRNDRQILLKQPG